MPQLQAPADSLAGRSPTVPIMCGRLFFSTSIGATLIAMGTSAIQVLVAEQ